MMGSSKWSEKPVHRVVLDGFCMDVTEVTVAAYKRCRGCSAPHTGEYCNWGKIGKENHPINCVSWHQAKKYCESGAKSLPTEAQWEYAARGGAKQLEYPWGSGEPTSSNACFGRDDGTCEVGTHGSWEYGLQDMAGNLWEWVGDWYEEYPSSVSKNYAGPPNGSGGVLRGGGWVILNASNLRGAYRRMIGPPNDWVDFIGFRCAR